MKVLKLFCLLFYLSSFIILSAENKSPNILIKLVIKQESPVAVVEKYYQKLSKDIPYKFLVVCKKSERLLKNPKEIEDLQKFQNLSVKVLDGDSNVDLFNQGIEEHSNWFDMLILATDEFEPLVQGYDKIISEAMLASFPDTDGVLYLQDEKGVEISSLPILGKKFYQRSGRLFHSDYKNFYHDKELSSISKMMAKNASLNSQVFLQLKPITASETQSLDDQIFKKRRAKNYDLKEDELKKLFPKDWSILICTLTERSDQFKKLQGKLEKQIREHNLQDKIEVLFFLDNRGEHTVGFKRNDLMRRSQGWYVNFIDDDDDIHDNYIKMIHERLEKKPDCVSLVGVITFNGNNPAKFIHSVAYKTYFNSNGIYYRPPNHLNTMKRIVASQFLFPTISFGEDTDWAMQIASSGLLNSEEKILTPYYFYKYVEKK